VSQLRLHGLGDFDMLHHAVVAVLAFPL
jgi:hypothetical protein